jgi:hypothetical protein
VLFVVLLIGSIYFIVFCRLMIHAHQAPHAAPAPGLAVVLSLPRRRGLNPQGLRYWRLYWLGWVAMILILCTGLLLRYPAIRSAFSGL